MKIRSHNVASFFLLKKKEGNAHIKENENKINKK